jgi:hypothetical protein
MTKSDSTNETLHQSHFQSTVDHAEPASDFGNAQDSFQDLQSSPVDYTLPPIQAIKLSAMTHHQ